MSLKKNVIANYFGQGWTALMGLVFAPIYIKYLGMEAYGLIGIFTMLQVWLSLLDMGMTPTLNREMARYTAGAHSSQSIRDLLRTLEVICVAIAIFIGLGIWLCSTWLATDWLHTQKISEQTLIQAISMMGLVIALRFIEGLYRGAIMGLQKQVWLSLSGAGLATLRAVGAVLILVWVSPSIKLFFLWQGIVSLLTIMVFIVATYQHLPTFKHSAQFSLPQLKAIWRFAAGIMATALLGLLLTQLDKMMLSRLLSLEMFGYYTLAGSVAAMLGMLITPITQAYYPRFTALVTQGDNARLISVYHQSAQLISVLVIPASLMLAFFGDKLLLLWTGNPLLSQNAAPLLSLLALGTMLNGLVNVLGMLALAHGWTRIGAYQSLIGVIVFAPSVIWATIHYGAIGAAWAFLILNIGFILIGPYFIFKRLLSAEKWRWYRDAVFTPVVVGTSMVLVLRQWLVLPQDGILMAAVLAAISFFLTGVLLWVTPTTRAFLFAALMGSSALSNKLSVGRLWTDNK